MIGFAVFSVFALLLIYGAVRDVTSFTIPNWVCAAATALFVPAALAADMALGALGLHVAVGAAALVCGMVMFALGWVGGGDAKLLAAVALWMGWPEIWAYLAVTAVMGGFFTVALIGARRTLGPVAEGFGLSVPLLERAKEIPYGVAIAGAALIYLPKTPLGSALIGSLG